MRYDYRCSDCESVFETSHAMDKKPRVKCPECGSLKTEVAFLTTPTSYIKGNGYLDVKGRRRDMNLYKLVNDDPYKGMRQPGEAADLAENLRRGGKRKKNPKHFVVKK